MPEKRHYMLEIRTAKPEETGVPSRAILNLLKRLDGFHIPMHSVLVMRNSRLIFEGYYAPWKKGELHRMFSVSKSFTSLAIGKLAEEGKIHLDDPITKYFPEYVSEKTHPWVMQTTIRNMLEMRTCHSLTTYKSYLDRNWVESFFVIEPNHKPGTVFHYDTSSSHTLCALVEKLTGKPMLDYLKDTVLREIGFSENSYMLEDPFGTSMGGSGLMATPEDFLRFGMLLMNRGQIDGKQLISRKYLEEACSVQVENLVKGGDIFEQQGYGYQFWCGADDSFMCFGMGGQFILCFPKQDLLCVTTADTQGIKGGHQQMLNVVCEELLPGLSESPLPAAESDWQELEEYGKQLHIKSVKEVWGGQHTFLSEKAENTGKGMMQQDKLEYDICENEQGFEWMQFDFAAGIFRFRLKGEEYQVRFGEDELAVDTWNLCGMRYGASGLWLDGNTFYIRIMLLDTACGSIHMQFYLEEEDMTVFMKKDDEMFFSEFAGHLYGKRAVTH